MRVTTKLGSRSESVSRTGFPLATDSLVHSGKTVTNSCLERVGTPVIGNSGRHFANDTWPGRWRWKIQPSMRGATSKKDSIAQSHSGYDIRQTQWEAEISRRRHSNTYGEVVRSGSTNALQHDSVHHGFHSQIGPVELPSEGEIKPRMRAHSLHRLQSEIKSRPTSAVCARPQTGYLEDFPEAVRGSHFTVRVADVLCCVPFEVPVSVTV